MTEYNNKILIEVGTEELPSDELNIYIKNLLVNFKKILKKTSTKYKKLESFITQRRIVFILDCIINNNYEIIKNIIEKIFYETSFKTNMRWNLNKNKFIRPIKWYILMDRTKIINHSIFNIRSNNISYSHKIKNKRIKITKQENYIKILKKNHVIINQKLKLNLIKKKLEKLSKQINVHFIINSKTLSKIANSIEYPNIIVCKFNKTFLKKLPEKIIISNLIDKQCIPTTNKFITNIFFSVIDTYVNNNKTIKNGYEKAIDIKLSESEFYYSHSKYQIENNKIKNLKKINITSKNGNLNDKIKRLIFIIKKIKYNKKKDIIKAILLSTIDTTTKIISEIPNLKAIISAHTFKLHNVSSILYEYNKSFNNIIPKHQSSGILTIIDYLDKIVGLFLLGEKPKNKKDPFGIKKDITIIIKTIISNKLKLNILKLIKLSLKSYNIQDIQLEKSLKSFTIDRILQFFDNNFTIKKIYMNNLYKNHLILNTRMKLKLYKFIQDLKIIIKRIIKITSKNKIQLKDKYIKHLDNNTSTSFLLKKSINIIKILKILLKKNLFFEYMKTLLLLKKYINNYFKNTFILDANKRKKYNNLKLLKIIERYLIFLTNLHESKI